MKAIRLAWLELRRFRGRLRWLAPIVLVLIPVLFGALFLWSNWDPYGKLNNVPVAVVNADQPVDSTGERVDAGDQFVRQLRTTDLFQWHFVDAAKARDGLEHGQYYFTITIPADFSAKLTSVTGPDPQRAIVTITKNDANGYLAGAMADMVRFRLQNEINAAAREAQARTAFRELDRVRQKLQLASELSGQLAQGSDLSKRASGALADSLDDVRNDSGAVTKGAQRVSAATAELDRQVSGIQRFTTEQLPAAVGAVQHASGSAVNSLSAIKTATGFLTDRAGDNVATLEALGQRPGIAQDPLYRQALDEARQVAGAAGNADDEAQQALATAQDANRQAATLENQVGPLRRAVQTINAPTTAVEAGTAQLTAGADGLSGGLRTLSSQSTMLRDGSEQLHADANRMRNLLGESLDGMPPTSVEEVARATEVLGMPSEIRTSALNPAHIYGRGLAPLLIPVALWTFGLIAYLLLKPVNTRALGVGAGAATVTFAGWLPAATLGTVGGLVLLGIVHFGLELNPLHLWWTAGLISLAALAFTAVAHFLRTALNTAGHVASVVLLLVQLVACGGLYPLETAPALVRAVHDFLPMTYVVDGLRVTISGGLTEHLLRDLAVLGGCLVAFLALSTWVVARQRVWTVRRLHPAFEL